MPRTKKLTRKIAVSTKPLKPKMSKAAFVRSLPADMHPRDVVAKAKEAGLIFLPQYVYGVRSADAASKGRRAKTSTAAKSTAPATAAKASPRAASKRSRKALSKTAFVLAQPSEMMAKDVVAKAKSEGLTISTAHVYAIRSDARRKSATAVVASHRPAKSAAAPVPTAAPAAARGPERSSAALPLASVESELKRLMLIVGVQRSREIAADLSRRLEGFLGEA